MAGAPLELRARATLAAALLLSLAVVAARAPEFSLRGSDGRTYTLSQFVGERGVVLAWFPKAFTPG